MGSSRVKHLPGLGLLRGWVVGLLPSGAVLGPVLDPGPGLAPSLGEGLQVGRKGFDPSRVRFSGLRGVGSTSAGAVGGWW